MSRKPRPIRIKFRRLPDDPDGRKTLGIADLKLKEIIINPDQDVVSMRGTAIHEVLHLELWDFDETAIVRIEDSIVDVLSRLDLLCMEKDTE